VQSGEEGSFRRKGGGQKKHEGECLGCFIPVCFQFTSIVNHSGSSTHHASLVNDTQHDDRIDWRREREKKKSGVGSQKLG
jgi:hypothetical protein